VLRTTLDKAYLKRTIRPLYGWTQATPKSCFLDPAWDRSVNIWPGMVMARTSGENYTLVGAGMQPSGLCGLFIGGDGIDEVRDQGVNALAVWVLGPDAEMEILSPGFDTSAAWVDPGNGTGDVLIHARTASVGTPTAATTTGLRGQLVPAGTAGSTLTATPVARLLKVLSPTKIIVGGLRGTV
jgi:hypothetical protein